MIVSDRHEFIFVHIPKCGGTTIRNALLDYDDRRSKFYDVGRADHPGLGPIDFAHLPIGVIEEYFPEEFALFDNYESYALVRDPLSRFCSALNYRMHRVKNMPAHGIGEEALRCEIAEVFRVLEGLEDGQMLPQDMVHFTPQCSYVLSRGRQKVRHVYKIEHLADLLAVLAEQTGSVLRETDSNATFRYRSRLLAKVDAAVQGVLQRLLPRSIWKPMFGLAKRLLLAGQFIEAEKENPLMSRLSPQDIAAIRSFYADDEKLYREAI